MKKFLKNKVTIASILIMVISSVLDHNNSFYHFCYTKINPPISEFVGKNILYGINRLVHRVDIIGKSKEFSNPLKEKDFIDLKLSSGTYNILIKIKLPSGEIRQAFEKFIMK